MIPNLTSNAHLAIGTHLEERIEAVGVGRIYKCKSSFYSIFPFNTNQHDPDSIWFILGFSLIIEYQFVIGSHQFNHIRSQQRFDSMHKYEKGSQLGTGAYGVSKSP